MHAPQPTACLRLQECMQRCVDRLGNVGALATISLKDGREVVIATGHPDRGRTESLSVDHLYQIGSQTKLFTAMAVLLLAKGGELGLGDPVGRYVDLGLDPRITLEMLLMNTSGLGEYADMVLNGTFPGGLRFGPDELVKLSLMRGSSFEPGLRFDYSNVGFVLLGLVVEAVSACPLAEFVRSAILQPLNLKDVCFAATEKQPGDRMARGYLMNRRIRAPLDMTGENMSWAFATGDMVANMKALVMLGRALLSAENPVSLTLSDLTRKLVNAADGVTNQPLSLGAEYGYGIERAWWAGRPVWGHRGGTAGYNSGTWIDAELGIIVTACVTTVRDFTEPELFAHIRYPGPQLFTLALATAYSLSNA